MTYTESALNSGVRRYARVLYTFSPAAKEDVCSIWAKLVWAGWELAYRPRVRSEEEIQAIVE